MGQYSVGYSLFFIYYELKVTKYHYNSQYSVTPVTHILNIITIIDILIYCLDSQNISYVDCSLLTFRKPSIYAQQNFCNKPQYKNNGQNNKIMQVIDCLDSQWINTLINKSWVSLCLPAHWEFFCLGTRVSFGVMIVYCGDEGIYGQSFLSKNAFIIRHRNIYELSTIS